MIDKYRLKLNNLRFHWNKILMVFFLVAMVSGASAQDEVIISGYATMKSIKDKVDKPLGQTNIKVLQEGKQFLNYTTTSSGSFYFRLPIGHNYTVEWSKPGFTTKSMAFDFKDVNNGDIRRSRRDYDFDMVLVETEFLTKDLKKSKQVNRVYWSKGDKEFAYQATQKDNYWQKFDELQLAYEAAEKDSKSQRMSALIFKVEDQIVRPDSAHDSLKILVLDDYNTFVQLKLLQKTDPAYASATIMFEEDFDKSEVEDYNILFAGNEAETSGDELLAKMNPEALLFTSNYGFHTSMVNFKNSMNDTKFEVNDIELIKRGFDTKEGLRAMAELTSDKSKWDEVIVDAQIVLKSEKEKSKTLEVQKNSLEILNEGLYKAKLRSDSILAEKAAQIAALEDNIMAKSRKLNALNAAMNKRNRELQEAQKIFELKQADLEKTVAALQVNEQKLQDFDSKLASTAMEVEKQQKLLATSMVRLETQKQYSYAIAGVLLLISILLFIAFRNYRKQRRYAIENEKQAERIELQRLLLKEKNTELNDSINYAKRIQDAMLPNENILSEHVDQMFILYQPKDIVAGDFYWMNQWRDTIYFAVADCTGHGVPGAMMSVVCHNAMNRAFRELGGATPAELLDKTREFVIEQVASSTENVRDGMDIALCAWNPKTKMLQFAGAQNPLWVLTTRDVKGNDDKMTVTEINDINLLEVKADKQPIGQYENSRPFENHTIQLESGDHLYVFSDGFADQFGGNKGKKLKQKLFKELLSMSSGNSFNDQREFLSEYFVNWRGQLEQIDDVCVMGVKV